MIPKPNIVNIVEQVSQSQPELAQQKPNQVTSQQIGSTSIYKVVYNTNTVTLTQDSTDGIIQVISTQEKPKEQIKPTTVQTTVNEVGNQVIVSNSVEKVTKIVPTAQVAVQQISKLTNIKVEEITSIEVNEETSEYIITSVDSLGKTT